MKHEYLKHFLINFSSHLLGNKLFLLCNFLTHWLNSNRYGLTVGQSSGLFWDIHLTRPNSLKLLLLRRIATNLHGFLKLGSILSKIVNLVLVVCVFENQIVCLDDLFHLSLLVFLRYGIFAHCSWVYSASWTSVCEDWVLFVVFITFEGIRRIVVLIIVLHIFRWQFIGTSACNFSLFDGVDSSDSLVTRVDGCEFVAISFRNRTQKSILSLLLKRSIINIIDLCHVLFVHTCLGIWLWDSKKYASKLITVWLNSATQCSR